MNVLILGAGVTGLSIGQLLRKKCDVTILEKDAIIGGIAKTKQVNGITYHTVGGHCFNSKHKEIMSLAFDLLPIEQWHQVKRTSRINMGQYEVDYPIEYSIKQIYEKDPKLAYEITLDFLSSVDSGSYYNLEEWFRQKFGNKLCDLYFLPYNTKIWGRSPNLMSHEWVQDKLPIPNKESFFTALMNSQVDNMPHSQFYYPNSNNQKTFIDALASNLNIICNQEAKSIKKTSTGWMVNELYDADILISTIPLNLLPLYVEGIPESVIKSAEQLKYNKVSNVFWESQLTDKTWTYQPSIDSIFHRYIHIGNFFDTRKNYTITEAIGVRSYEEMVEYGRKDPFLIAPLDYNISEHAYVVYDENRDKEVKHIQEYLESINLISIGRFGQWDYFNMDICMKQSYETYLKILKWL